MSKITNILKVTKGEMLGLIIASVMVSGVCATVVSVSTPAHAHTAQTSHICSYAKFASN